MPKLVSALLVCLWLAASPASATTYYVRTDGNDANTGTANTSGGAWRHIDWGFDHAAADDVVRVQAGNYAETATPGVSGTSGHTITIVADGAVTTCGLTYSAKSYIRVIGLTVDGNASGCSNIATLVSGTGTNTGLEWWGVTFTNTTGKAVLFDFYANSARCDKCIWIGGGVTNIGVTSPVIALSPSGSDVFVAYLSFSGICYGGIAPSGVRGRFLNNYFTGMLQCGTSHPDFFYVHGLSTLGFSNNLIESTFGIGTPTADNNKFHHQQNESAVDWDRNVYRLNVGTNIGSGAYSLYSTSSGNVLHTFWYHDTWVNNDRAVSTSDACGGYRADNATTLSLYFFNELFQECWGTAKSTNIDAASLGGGGSGTTSVTKNYNLAYDPDGALTFTASWNAQANKQSNVNPSLHNIGLYDFTLDSGSLARGVGGPLTTAVGAGSSSTSLTVAAGFGGAFVGSNASNLPQYGGNLVPGDFITVGSTTVQVSSVSGDVLTLATAISWSNGASVCFGTSCTVDIGAYPYKAGGYALTATYTNSAGTVTVTPNDASLVRFLVCYEDGIPTAVVNASPYTCAVGAGAIIARVFPRYASATLSVDATLTSAPTATGGLMQRAIRRGGGLRFFPVPEPNAGGLQ